MKYVNKFLLLLVTSLLFTININAEEEEKSYAYQRNQFYCAGNPDPVTIEGCYFDANSEQDAKTYGDFYSNENDGLGEKHMLSSRHAGQAVAAQYYYVKSAKFMQAYTVFNNDEKAVLGLCYVGYLGELKRDLGACEPEQQEYAGIVKEKDEDHPYPVVFLRVIEPRGNNCVSSKNQIVWNKKQTDLSSVMKDGKENIDIDTTSYEGYKTGSCPKYFNFTSNLKGLAKWVNSDKEFTFSDDPEVHYKKYIIDSLLSTDYSGRITGCTQKDVEGEEFKTDCYDKKIEKAQKYVCPADIKDFDLDLGNYAEECDPLKQLGKSAYSRTYLEKMAQENGDRVKQAYADKVEECTEKNCGLTSAEMSSVKAKLKGTVCEYGCKLAVYESGTSTTEGKCIACGGSQGVTYRWANKDYTPSGNCSEVNLDHDKCLGDSKTQACSACYKTAYAGLSEDKRKCLENVLSEKAEKIQEHNIEVDKIMDEKVEEGVEELKSVQEQSWNASFVTFTIPGMSEGGFGPKGQSCSEILKNNGVKIIKGIVNVLRIAAVIIAIANAMITLVPAVISKDADGLKKAGRKLVVMAVVLAIVGILPSIVYLIGVVFGYDLSCIF